MDTTDDLTQSLHSGEVHARDMVWFAPLGEAADTLLLVHTWGGPAVVRVQWSVVCQLPASLNRHIHASPLNRQALASTTTCCTQRDPSSALLHSTLQRHPDSVSAKQLYH